MTPQIIPVFCNDNQMANYAYLIQQPNSDKCVIIDASEARPIIDTLNMLKLTPTHILTTHHHFDHVGGNVELKEKYGLKIIAPEHEFDLVPMADIAASSKQKININNLTFEVIEAPGHTAGHVLYYIEKYKALFTGDVLFNLCIGGLFEGTPQQMINSLAKISKLADDTQIFPGHEYARAAITKDMLLLPDFDKYINKINQREHGKLAPSTLLEEKLYNPYLKMRKSEDF